LTDFFWPAKEKSLPVIRIVTYFMNLQRVLAFNLFLYFTKMAIILITIATVINNYS
jgi:hypothetical protein